MHIFDVSTAKMNSLSQNNHELKLYPLISCICITRNRVPLLRRAIECFTYQTYLNKELIIIFENDDKDTTDFFLNNSFKGDIKPFVLNKCSKIKLGELRNIGISYSRGEYICQWDDDDFYHIFRLEKQFNSLQSSYSASVFKQWILYDSQNQNSYLSNLRLWEGSLFCKKEWLLKFPYPNKNKGEDSEVIDKLKSKKQIFAITNSPHLYIYNYHGKNTWDFKHFKMFFLESRLINLFSTLEINKIMKQSLDVADSSILLDELLHNNYL
jgi:hypothetical protein